MQEEDNNTRTTQAQNHGDSTGKWDRIRRNIYFRIFTNKYLIVTAGFLVIGFLDPNGITSLLRNKKEIALQEASIRKYRQDIQDIGERIEGMSTKRDSVEKYAREEYYYHREDEDIFIMK